MIFKMYNLQCYGQLQLSNSHELKKVCNEDRKILIDLIQSNTNISTCVLNKIGGHVQKLHITPIRSNLPKNIAFPYIKQLLIGDGNFSNINLDFISNQQNLNNLFILRCDLKQIPKIEGPNELTNLYLSGNKIVSLSGIEQLESLSKLGYLDLSRNLVVDLCKFKPLSKLPILKELDLQFNNIQDLNITYDVPKLFSLNLSNNQISHITALKNLSNLRFLQLDHNTISKIENISNLPNLKYLNLGYNNLTKLENLSNLLRLNEIDVEKNDIKLVSGLEYLPELSKVGVFNDENLLKIEVDKLSNYFKKIEWDYEYDGVIGGFIFLGPSPRKFFIVNNYITLKLVGNRTVLYLNDKKYIRCAKLLINYPVNQDWNGNIRSIDDAEEASSELYKETDFKLSAEQEFWGHCSNLQAWAENNYDTRLLHRSLAFPLLARLTKLEDSIAKRVFKEEIAKRYQSGHPTVRKFLKKEGFLTYLSEEELSSLK